MELITPVKWHSFQGEIKEGKEDVGSPEDVIWMETLLILHKLSSYSILKSKENSMYFLTFNLEVPFLSYGTRTLI